jgi:cytochrome c peroxidase
MLPLVVIAGVLSVATMILRPPLGLDLHMPVPETNPLTREKIALGKRLFFDKQLSRDRTLSCASCHKPQYAFSDGRLVARGVGDAEGVRNSPALINRGYGTSFFWDGRAASLERQVLEPIVNPKEMALSIPELERRTKRPVMQVTLALASYVRTIRSGNSRFDQYVAGNPNALTAIERDGLALFRGRGQCWVCHSGPNFTDEQFHNTGIAWQNGRFADDGRFAVTARAADRGAFKTPTLREVARTAPYMHDGSLPTLDAVIDFYSHGGRQNPQLDLALQPTSFSQAEKAALIAFLRSLAGQVRR